MRICDDCWPLAALAAAIVTLLFTLVFDPALSACGDRGGPGYRSKAGRCVGWEALVRECGNPPATKCSAENVSEGSGEAAAKAAAIRSQMERSHKSKEQMK
jgi:hypothetical protein